LPKKRKKKKKKKNGKEMVEKKNSGRMEILNYVIIKLRPNLTL